jgi:hypothetical protein
MWRSLSCAFGGDYGKFNAAKPLTEDWQYARAYLKKVESPAA